MSSKTGKGRQLGEIYCQNSWMLYYTNTYQMNLHVVGLMTHLLMTEHFEEWIEDALAAAVYQRQCPMPDSLCPVARVGRSTEWQCLHGNLYRLARLTAFIMGRVAKVPNGKICRVDGCKYTTEDTSNLRQHRQNIHNIGVIWCYCTQPGCDKRFKQKHVLQNHLFSIHNVGKSTRRGSVSCTTCKRKFQSKYALKEHVLINHTPEEEVNWFHCTVSGCNMKFRKNAYLLRHYRRKHKIPVHGTPGRPSKYKAEGRGGEWRSLYIWRTSLMPQRNLCFAFLYYNVFFYCVFCVSSGN